MAIKIPKKRAFYYEITNLRDRLIYWIPKEDLEGMVKRGEVRKKIIDDFPFGLDIEVYQENFNDFKDKYDLKISLDTKNILLAFQAIKNKYGKKFPRTGLVNARELENIAQDLCFEIEHIPEFRRREIPGLLKKEPDKKSFRREVSFRKKTKSILMKLKFEGLNVKAPIQEQALFKVDMTKGEDAFDTLSRLHQNKPRRK